MTDLVQILLIVIAGIIHILPVSGLLGSDKLKQLYALDITETNLLILMKHRAVLFGILGVFMVYAAFDPTLQHLAVIVGLVSAASFIIVAKTSGTYSPAIRRIIHADWIAIGCLLVACLL